MRMAYFLASGAALLAATLSACEPFQPRVVAVVVTSIPTFTPIPTVTPTPTVTRTPLPSPTPDWTPTPTPFPCEETGGQLLEFRDNPSPSTNENIRYLVYLPPCYGSSARRFPVLYLIHGMSYREQQWLDLGLPNILNEAILAGRSAPFVVVMPFLGSIGGQDRFPPNPSYETVIVDELRPQIESTFCTINTAQGRAIGGISRGGFWAYSIAMRHNNLFGQVGGFSAYFPANAGLPPANDPLELVLNETPLRESGLRMYLANGAADSSGPSQQLFSARLSARGIQHTYVVHPSGEHNNDYWRAHLAEFLAWFSQPWTREYSLLPSCAEPSP
ncbi:MAG: alpha/beta hydrolase-fold protein [Anaerolineae bacterium]|nr:alpha/beta hydrolase-fold protein [Anaerolineae bacterium]MDW8172231.1 alpha/beta hydrolase-fold protein [Anaerolineae bacterium]